MKKISFVYAVILIVLTLTAPAAITYVSQAVVTQSVASEGGPIATCRPGTNCDPSTKLQQLASEGGPIATCRPGTNCDPSTKLREVASYQLAV